MNNKLTAQFIILTFTIMLTTWGTMIILAQFGIAESTHPWVFVLQLIGGLSPAIASYTTLRKNIKIARFYRYFNTIRVIYLLR